MTRPVVALIITRTTTLAYPELLPELVGDLQALGLRVTLSLIEHEGAVDAALAELETEPLDGIIAAARPSDAALQRAARAGAPLMLYNCHAPLAASVGCDHGACGRQLALMLIEGGHRRFGLIAGPPESLVARERLRGALDVLVSPQVLTCEVVQGDYGYDSGAGALDALFAAMKPRPSAVIAMNDAMALGALDRARALQVRIPRDLSVVGIDGTGLARLPVYGLTTMRQPLRRMAAAAAEMMRLRLAQSDLPAEARLFAGELIRGRTARFEHPRRASAETALHQPAA